MTQNNYAEIKVRLDQIAEAVQDEDLSLDAALELYEEAIKLGTQVSDLIEKGILPNQDATEANPASENAEEADAQNANAQDTDAQDTNAQDTDAQDTNAQDAASSQPEA